MRLFSKITKYCSTFYIDPDYIQRDQMTITRRSAIKTIAGALALPAFSPISSALAQSSLEWTTYEIVTEVNLQSPDGAAQTWIPLPLVLDTNYFRTLAIRPEASDPKAINQIYETPNKQARMLWTKWDKSATNHSVKVSILVSTRNRNLELSTPNPALKLSKEEQRFWTRPTKYLPTDGIVKVKSQEALAKAPMNATDVEKAKAIYNWVVDNTHRDPKTRGCGQGDVKLMLETNNLGGKCADINAVFVAMARSAGIPARDVYGIRIADSARGYKSLGKSGEITKAQHCRAEFYASGYGWVPVDPADVRKVILEETGGLAVTDPKVLAIRDYLFGNWEMNWMAYNYDHDIALPGSKLGSKGDIPFLMYPQAENMEGRFDSLDPDNFQYKITSRRIG
jgi:transglutaminase-like putative cysteine protease